MRDVLDKHGEKIGEDHREDIKETLFKMAAKYPTLSEILENFEAIKPADKGEMGDDLHEMDVADRVKLDHKRFKQTNFRDKEEDNRIRFRRRENFRKMIQAKWLTFFFGLYENEDQSYALAKIRGNESHLQPWPIDYTLRLVMGSWTLEDGKKFENAGREFGQEIIKISEEDKHGLKNLLETLNFVVAIIGISKRPMACPDCRQPMYDFPEDPKCHTCGKYEWHDYQIMQKLVDSAKASYTWKNTKM